MNTLRHSDRGFIRICCLLTVGATILPLTLTGQAPSTGHVWVQVGASSASVTAPPPASELFLGSGTLARLHSAGKSAAG